MQDNNNSHGQIDDYPQDIELLPQGVNQQSQEQAQPPIRSESREERVSVQQGSGYQSVPPQAVKHDNYPIANQMFRNFAPKQIAMIETKIKGFCCYSCLLYFELIFTMLGLLSIGSLDLYPVLQLMTIVVTLALLAVYFSAIRGISNFDSNQQEQTFIIFSILTAVRFGLGAFFYSCLKSDGSMPSSLDSLILSIIANLVMDLALVYNSYQLTNLKKEREQIIMKLNSLNNIA